MVDIAAFDPGTTTGIATLTEETFSSFELKPKDFPHPHEILFDTVNGLQPKIIVYESFHFRSGQLGAVFDGVEYIGVLELYAQIKCIPSEKQSPAMGKSGFWDDKKLKILGLHKPGKPHANDAMRHLLAFRAKKDPNFMKWVLNHFREQPV